jgi:SAM-dependent methyltransferase
VTVETLSPDLQPDQQPTLWGDHVSLYEAVFEPLTNAFATRALDALGVGPGLFCLDVGAGSGGAALLAAQRGASVVATDASIHMARRIAARARGADLGRVYTAVMDGTVLALADASIDIALSIFGLILFPDPIGGLREIGRVLKRGGRVAVVTWTEPHRYELAARLGAAIAAVGGPQPAPATLPAQLRFCEEAAFRDLFGQAGLTVERITAAEDSLCAPSARWLAERLAFAPGLAAWLAAQDENRAAVLDRFAADLERDQGLGPVVLTAVALLGVVRR